jgi:hypothetical protein
MAFLPALLPYVAAGGALIQGVQAKNAQDFNAQVMGQTKNVSIDQANAQEGMVRRHSREELGKEAAAFGGAGVGYGGSSETALDQSAVSQELDALNTRYKGATTGYGYGVQSGIDRSQGRTDMTQASLLAGGALLKGMGSNYTFTPGGSDAIG